MESDEMRIERLEREKRELLDILQKAFSLHDKGDLCHGDLLSAVWSDEAEAVIARVTN